MNKIKITFFKRKSRSAGNYSLEFIFNDVRNRLSQYIDAQNYICKYESSGLFKRLFNILHASLYQNQVNHITGDINFIGLLMKKSRTIQTILDVVYLKNSHGIKHKILKLIWLSLPEKRCCFITAISTSTKNEILKYHPCNPDKIRVIYVAISQTFNPSPKIFNNIKPVILQLGTAQNKNIPRLIEALNGLNCHLEIVGKKQNEYIELLSISGISYNYIEHLSEVEILEKYYNADIVCMISTYEGFGMPILEGQAVGRPVITSDVYSMPEVAGDAALLVNPYDIKAIRAGFERLIFDVNFRNELIQRGFANVKRFDAEIIAKQYLDLYKEVINSN